MKKKEEKLSFIKLFLGSFNCTPNDTGIYMKSATINNMSVSQFLISMMQRIFLDTAPERKFSRCNVRFKSARLLPPTILDITALARVSFGFVMYVIVGSKKDSLLSGRRLSANFIAHITVTLRNNVCRQPCTCIGMITLASSHDWRIEPIE